MQIGEISRILFYTENQSSLSFYVTHLMDCEATGIRYPPSSIYKIHNLTFNSQKFYIFFFFPLHFCDPSDTEFSLGLYIHSMTESLLLINLVLLREKQKCIYTYI